MCVRMDGQVIAAAVPSPQQPASHQMACFAAGEGSVCVVSACATTPNTPETSASAALHAKAPASHTGN